MGGIRGAKKIGELMKFAARDLDDGQVEITLPDGSVVSTLDARRRRAGERGARSPVRLERLHDATDVDHYRRGRARG